MENKIFLFVAPSGAGKSTIIKEIFAPEQIIKSFTTRPIRKGEIDGDDYYFVNNEEFDYLESLDGELIQKAEYVGNRYGVTKGELESSLKNGHVAIAVVMDGGYDRYVELYPESTVGVFLSVSEHIVKERLEKRNDGKEIVQKRLAQYKKDIQNEKFFKSGNNFIVNVDGSLKDNVRLVKEVIDKC